MSKIVLTGGGTAGHIMPHIALLEKLKKEFDEIHYIGSKNGLEKEILKSHPEVIFHEITTVKLKRSLSLANLAIPFKLLKGISQSKKLLKQIKPDVIFSKGGFVAVPVCFAASKLKIPIVSHESDITLGLANKLIYKKCDVMCCSFLPTCSFGKKCMHTGSAIREELLLGNKETEVQKLGLNQNLPTILFMGGSLGANKINDLVFECKNKLLEKYNIIHICGKGKKRLESAKPQTGKYLQIEFAINPAPLFACADIVVCRSGSNTIFEMLALNKPMLLLPLSKKASRGDQILNSQNFKENGFASFILDENLNSKVLTYEIENLIKNKSLFVKNMHSSKFKLGNDLILSQILKFKK